MNATRAKWYKGGLLGLAVILFFGTSQAQRFANRDRQALGLTRITPLDNAPPVLAFTTVALGGFRGLIANFLWIRANDLQDQDKYFEMVQLADWITKLEPHYVQVWNVQAWNMAYNISVKFKNAPDRWRWVKAGIELLRDEGLKYNPDETLIYRELAWFFQHKMGQNMDDAHLFYKNAWFTEMSEALKGRPNYQELLNPPNDEAKGRVKILREKYKMDPAIMQELDQKYGPLEWRLPEASAIYWASLGLKKAKREDLITLRRVIFQCMQMAFQRGSIIEDKLAGKFVLGPNLDIISNANAAYEEQIRLAEPQTLENLRGAHKNFLLNVPYFLYLYNRQADAQRWFAYLKKTYPTAIQDYLKLQNLSGSPNLTVEEYAVVRVGEDAGETNHDKMMAIVSGLLVNSYLDLVADEEDRYTNYQNLARRVHTRFQGEVAKRGMMNGVNPIALPEFTLLQKNVLEALLDADRGLKGELNARLRTKLGLPAGTNQPPAAKQ